MSHFPVKIVYAKTGETVIVDRPEDLRKGMAFRVLEANVNKGEMEKG